MALVQIAAQDVPNYTYTGTLHELWISTDRAWFAEDGGAGTPVQFVTKYTVTVVGTTATIPTVSLYSQNDAPNDRTGRYQAFFYVDGAQRDQFCPNTLGLFQVPSTPTTTTWEDLETFNATARKTPQDSRTYTAVQINELLDDITAGVISGAASGDLAGVYPNPTIKPSVILTTPTIGVATATSVNKVAITAPAASATLTIANGKTLTASASLALTGTDGTTQTFQASDTIVGRATTDTLSNKTFVAPVLGAATATSINKVGFTQPANGSTLTIAEAKTLTASNSLTLAGTDGTTQTFQASDTIVGRNTTDTLTNKTLTTPVLGVATATSINKVALTAPATSATITITDGKTFAASNSLTLAGTDGTTITFQGTDTYVGRATTDTLTNKTLTSPTMTAPVLGVATGTSLAATGLIKSSGTAGIGYATGAGGTVTQATNKSTGVTLSKTCGAITMDAASLAAATIVSFVLTNTTIAATDVLILNHLSGGTVGSYTLNAQAAAGSATINVRNNTAGALAEAVVISFVVIKAVAA